MVNINAGDHWAYFGDGNAAQILDSKEYIKNNGQKFVKFVFLPSNRIENSYPIKSNQDPNSGAVIQEYHWGEIVWLDRGSNRSRCWIFTDFIGGSTPASRKQDDLVVALKDSERLIRSAEAAKNRAYQELEQERQQQLQAIKTKVMMLKEIQKGKGRSEEEGFDDGADD